MKVIVACGQISATGFTKEENIKKMENLTKEAKKERKNLDLIVFPELALTGFVEDWASVAEEFPKGSSVLEMSKVAKENSVHIVFGFVEKGEDGLLYNTAALINDKGEVMGKYRKIHLIDVERLVFEPGNEFNVFDTPFGKLGIMICWDTAFPETAKILALKGAEIIAIPAMWESPREGDWDIVHAARSFDNVVYTVASNFVGNSEIYSYFGKSKISGPLGRVIKEMGDEEGVITSEVDVDVLKELREGYYVFKKDRRPDLYDELTKEN